MVINKIILNNFRVYHGVNELSFNTGDTRNVSIVAGNNGFGKTSLLTSLVWCLYGKLMADVDERYRREIYESGGYKRYCEKIMNWLAFDESNKAVGKLKERLLHENAIEKRKTEQDISRLSSFSVSIHLGQLFIPSVPCEEVVVKRNYNTQTHQEEVEILIDGRPNELTRGMGESIFINDFILPKEIAKFFFFDAEKIVSLAEIRTAEEKKSLSYAYAEVLGIKKYADLKETLENLQFRIRNKSSKKEDKAHQQKLQKAIAQNEKMIAHYKGMIEEKREELVVKKAAADKLQEQLIREGTSLSVEDLKQFKTVRDGLASDGQKIKSRFQELMELAPFAIAAGKLQQVKEQLETEHNESGKSATVKLLTKKAKEIEADLVKNKRKLGLTKDKENLIMQIVHQRLDAINRKSFKVLLNFSDEKYNHFNAIHANLSDAFNRTFRQVIKDLKIQQSSLLVIQRKLSDGESKENDPVIKRVRQDKQKLESSISEIETELIKLEAQVLIEQQEMSSNTKVLNEVSKNIRVEEKDNAKDELAGRLIAELTEFIHRLKVKKKTSLEDNIQRELNRLMHKALFVNQVKVIIEGDLIDIELYDKKGQVINKDGLSKGEQQLYATALLRSLISESNIQFPVFIDSPLQKFDKDHSENIIKGFYPNVSVQVVLFPLLDKELTEQEYKWLLPSIAGTYLINNKEEYSSEFISVKPAKLFEVFRQENQHVH